MLFVSELYEDYVAKVTNSETMKSMVLNRKEILLLSKTHDIVGVATKYGEITEMQEFEYLIVDYDCVGQIKADFSFMQNGKTWLLRKRKTEMNAYYSSSRNVFFVRTDCSNVTYLADPKENVGKYTGNSKYAKEFSTFDEAKGTAVTMTKRGNKNVAWRVE